MQCMFMFGEQNGDKMKTCRELINPLINMAVVKYLTIRNIFNYSVNIRFKTSTVAHFTCNQCQQRSCYRPRNL